MYYHRNKQYQCNVCDQSFVYQSKLKQHKRRHTKLKMYQCFHGGCNRKYRHPQDLTRHIKSHQEKSFECDFCDKKFAEKRLLKRHLIVYQNIKVYKCEKCVKGLSIIINYTDIVKNVHDQLLIFNMIYSHTHR